MITTHFFPENFSVFSRVSDFSFRDWKKNGIFERRNHFFGGPEAESKDHGGLPDHRSFGLELRKMAPSGAQSPVRAEVAQIPAAIERGVSVKPRLVVKMPKVFERFFISFGLFTIAYSSSVNYSLNC